MDNVGRLRRWPEPGVAMMKQVNGSWEKWKGQAGCSIVAGGRGGMLRGARNGRSKWNKGPCWAQFSRREGKQQAAGGGLRESQPQKGTYCMAELA